MTTLDQCVKDADWTDRLDQAEKPATKITDTTDRDADACLVERAVSGQRTAYDFLVIKYQHRVASLVSRYARNPADVSDITQETFVRAWTALPRFRNDSAFYTWLYRIAVNTALNHINGRRRQVNETDLPGDRTIEDGLNHNPGLDGPAADHEATELDRVVKAALRDLPEDMRQALHFREWEGLSYQAIAETMQVPVGTVRSRIFRAREAIDVRIQAWRSGGDVL